MSAYISLTDKAMGFEQLSDEKFRVAFQFQVLLNYDDGTYCLMHSAAVFMNLWINVATAGNDFSTENYGVEGGTGVEFTQYFGNYTAEDNPYDDTMENITLGDAIRVVATRTVGSGVSGQGSGGATAVSGYLADTMYWTAEMSAATGRRRRRGLSRRRGVREFRRRWYQGELHRHDGCRRQRDGGGQRTQRVHSVHEDLRFGHFGAREITETSRGTYHDKKL